MSRNSHYMRTSAGGTSPRSVVSVSCTRLDGNAIVWRWSHLTPEGQDESQWGKQWGTDARSFWATLQNHLKHHRITWVYMLGACHTLASLGFWDLLEGDEWQLEGDDERSPATPKGKPRPPWQGYAVLEDPPTVILARPRASQGACKFLDVRNYGVSGLDALGVAADNPYHTDVDTYSRVDAIQRFVVGWIATVKKHRLGSVQTTAASQAMHAFRHRFLRSPLLVHDNTQALQLERMALYAGRNECWRVGKVKGPVFHLDMNSCYPASACGEMMPARLAGYSLGCKPSPDELMRQGYLVIAEVTLEASVPDYPVKFSWQRHGPDYLRGMGGAPPMRPQDGDMIYPVGRFATALCGPELSHALENNAVKRVWSVAWYEPADLLTQWATELHAIGEAAWASKSVAESECVKRVRNALIGKFAQWAWRWVACPSVAASAPFSLWYGPPPTGNPPVATGNSPTGNPPGATRTGGGPMVRYRSIGWTVQVEEGMGEHVESCPAISAWVYSLARMRLRGAIETAGRDNIYYMDADSLWCNHKGYRRMEDAGMIDARALGQWKLVGSHEWVAFHGLKMYDTPSKSIHSGAPGNAVGSHADGWRFWAPERLMPALAHDRAPGQEMIPMTLKSSNTYRHGRVCIDGRVMPFCFAEEDC